MKRIVAMVALGIGGFVAAIGLTVGALALAGDDTASVVHPQLSRSREPTERPSPSREDDRGSETPSPSVDDHGDASGSDDSSGHGSDDSGSDDSSGHGSDDSGSDDSSGHGSDDSGSDEPDDD